MPTPAEKGLDEALPFLVNMFQENDKRIAERKKQITDYYLDLLKSGELQYQEPKPAYPLPQEKALGLADYFNPPQAPVRNLTPQEDFNVLDALSQGGEVPSGVSRKQYVIPKGMVEKNITQKGNEPPTTVYESEAERNARNLLKSEALALKKSQVKNSLKDTEIKDKLSTYSGIRLETDNLRAKKIAQGIDPNTDPDVQLWEKRAEDSISAVTATVNGKYPGNPLTQSELVDVIKEVDPNLWQKIWGKKPEPTVTQTPITKGKYVVNQIVDLGEKGKWVVKSTTGAYSPSDPDLVPLK